MDNREKLRLSEARIRDALYDVLDAYGTIGIIFTEIHTKELWEATHSTWKAYVEERLYKMNPEMNQRRVFELMRLGARLPDIVSKCREMGFPRPENECQMRPLLKLTPPEAVGAWINVASKAKERNVRITGESVAAEAALYAERA